MILKDLNQFFLLHLRLVKKVQKIGIDAGTLKDAFDVELLRSLI
jgi:hypothetical protein